MEKKVVVYTAIMGKYNKLREIKNLDKNIEYICFTNQKIKSKTWKIVKVRSKFNNSHLDAKLFKMLPHLYFNCDYSLWVDASIEIYGNILNLINSHFDKDTDIVLFKHKVRDCPYCEANVIISLKLANPIIVKAQMNKYFRNGFPLHKQLSQGGVILRKHSKKMEIFNLTWWGEICRYTQRDQLSLDYCLNKTNIRLRYFDLPKLYEHNGYFNYYGHKKSISHIKVLLKTAIIEKSLFDIKKLFPAIIEFVRSKNIKEYLN